MEACPDPIQMRIHILPKTGVPGLLGYQTGKSNLMIFDWHASLKYRYGKWEFWCRWYLCGHGWKEQENDCGASPQSITARRVIGVKEQAAPFPGGGGERKPAAVKRHLEAACGWRSVHRTFCPARNRPL